MTKLIGKAGMSCRLAADRLDELHSFVSEVGTQVLCLGQDEDFHSGPFFPHYHLSATSRQQALDNGAIEISRAELIRRLDHMWEMTEASAMPEFKIGGVRVFLDYPIAKEMADLLRREASEKDDQGWGDLAHQIDLSLLALDEDGAIDLG